MPLPTEALASLQRRYEASKAECARQTARANRYKAALHSMAADSYSDPEGAVRLYMGDHQVPPADRPSECCEACHGRGILTDNPPEHTCKAAPSGRRSE